MVLTTSNNLSKQESLDNSWIVTLEVQTLWKGLLLFVATLFSHWQAIGGGFIWDDDAHVTRAGLRTLDGLWAIWTKLGATQQYYPLVHSFFWFEQLFWGDAAQYYHVTNIVLHTLVAFLVVAIVKELGIRGAWVAGFIFALHPVHVESVAWITEQKNTISALFYLSAALMYLKFDKERVSKLYIIATSIFFCALLSKTVTATLPAALLVVFWWKRGRLSFRSDVLLLIPWLILGGAGGYFTAWVERVLIGAQGADYQSAVVLNPLTRCLLAGHAIWFYFSKLIWPTNLIFIYEHWTISASNPFDYIYTLGFIVVISAFYMYSRQVDSNKHTGTFYRGPLAGALFFSGTLFPVLGFANVYPFMFSYVADHFQYLASLGVIVPLAALLTSLVDKLSLENKGIGSAIGGVMLGLIGVLSWNQCQMYKSGESLYRVTIERNPNCWMAHNNLGAIVLAQGKILEAQLLFKKALDIRPRYPDAQSNMCSTLIRLGRPQEAILHGYEAVKLRPTSPENENNLAIALVEIGRLDEAITHYINSIKLRPNYVEVWNNLGNAYAALAKNGEAISCYQNAIKFDTTFADAFSNYGSLLVKLGNIKEGIDLQERAVRLNINSARYHAGLGAAYISANRKQEAVVQFQNSLQLDPNNSDVWFNLGNVYANTGNYKDAEVPYLNTLKLNANNIGAENNLAAVYFKLGRNPEAMMHYQFALKLNPNYAEAHSNYGVVLVASKLIDDGIREYEKAISLDPKYADAINNLGLALQAQGKRALAYDAFRRCVSLDPKNTNYLYNLKRITDLLHATPSTN